MTDKQIREFPAIRSVRDLAVFLFVLGAVLVSTACDQEVLRVDHQPVVIEPGQPVDNFTGTIVINIEGAPPDTVRIEVETSDPRFAWALTTLCAIKVIETHEDDHTHQAAILELIAQFLESHDLNCGSS